MKKTSLCRVLVVGISFIAVVVGQSPGKGENIVPATPQELMTTKQIWKLEAQADNALSAGKYALAETYARKGQSLAPDGHGCLNQLAEAFFAQGKDQEALQAYKKITEGNLSPYNVIPYALLLIKHQHYAEAVTEYNSAIAKYDPRDLANVKGAFAPDMAQPKELETACHIELGHLWTEGGVWGGSPNFDKALDEYQRALQLSPDNALANYYKGDVLKRLGFKAQAQDAYARAAKFGEGDVRKAAEDALAR